MAGKYLLTKYKPAATTSEVSRSTQMTEDDIIQFEGCFTDQDACTAAGRGPSRSRSFVRTISPARNCDVAASCSEGSADEAFKFAGQVSMRRLKARKGRESKENPAQLGPKRSYSSKNLTQSACPDHGEPTVILETHRSCESSPNRSRPDHCHETRTILHGQDADLNGQASHLHYRNTVSPNSRRSHQFYPTQNRYFNALDAAANIRSALKKSQTTGSEGCCPRAALVKEGSQGGMCVAKNRPLQRLRILKPTPGKFYNPSNLENFKVGEPRCVDDMPQGLATVLGPKIPPDWEFQIQKRAPRGLAAVVDRCSVETGQQTAEDHVSSCPLLDSISQHEAFSSFAPNNSRVVTNIDMLEEIKTPSDCDGEECEDSFSSSRTSIKMESVQQGDQMEILEQQGEQLQALQQQLQGMQQEQQLKEQLKEHHLQLHKQQQQLIELRQRQQQEQEELIQFCSPSDNSCHESLNCAASVDSCDDNRCEDFQQMEPPLRSSSSWEPTDGDRDRGELNDDDLFSSDVSAGLKRKRSSKLNSSTFREPSRQFDPDNEDSVRQPLEKMSFNDRLEGRSNYVDTSSVHRGSEFPLASSMSEIPHTHRHEPIYACGSNTYPSSKASMVSFNQSTVERICSSRGSTGRNPSPGRSLSSRCKGRSGDPAAMIKAITEVREPKTLRSIVKHAVQRAVQQEVCMQKAVQKAIQEELTMRSSIGGQSSKCFTEDEASEKAEKLSRRSSRSLTSDEQNSFADAVAAARKSMSSPGRSKSRSKSRMRVGSSDASDSYPQSVSLNASTSKSSGRPNSKSPPPAGMTYQDRMASITQLLNNMNSVTQLLNSMPVHPDDNHPPAAGQQAMPRKSSLSTTSSFMPGPKSPQFDLATGSILNSPFDQPQFNDMGAINSQGGLSGQFPGQQFLGTPSIMGFDPNNLMQQPRSQSMPGMGYDPNNPMQQPGSQSMPGMGYDPNNPMQQPRSQSMPGMGYDPNNPMQQPRSQSMPGMGYDPNNPMQQPRSLSMPGMGYDPNNPMQQPRSQSMPGMRYDPNNPMQQPRSQSMPGMGSFNRQPYNSQPRGANMIGQRRSLRNTPQAQSDMKNQRRSSRRSASPDMDSNEDLEALSSLASNPESEGDDTTELDQDASEAIPEEDESATQEGDTGGESGGSEQTDGQTEDGGGDEDEEGSPGEGMAATYQPTMQSQRLEQMPQPLQSVDKCLNGSSQNPKPALLAIPHQFEIDANNTKSFISAQMVTKTDMANSNVPNEFQKHLSNVHSHIPQQLEPVKSPASPRKSLSTIVEAMLQELEVLECKSRQKSAAYGFSSLPKQDYSWHRHLQSEVMISIQEKL